MVTVGIGFTVMVKVAGAPVQLLVFGITVMRPLMGAAVALVAVNEGRLPVPLPLRPMAILPFVQL